MKPIQIYGRNGRVFDITNLKPADVDIETIASTLSKLCRFGGRLSAFYSVAQHSLHVREMVVEAGFRELARAALLHDAAEAFIGDIVTPLKRELTAYVDCEQRYRVTLSDLERGILTTIFSALDVRWPTPDQWEIINFFDKVACNTEAKLLMDAPEWSKFPQPATFFPYPYHDGVGASFVYVWNGDNPVVQNTQA